MAQQATAGPLPAYYANPHTKMAALFAPFPSRRSGTVAPNAAALAKGVLHAMLLTKIKVATMVLVTVGAMGVGSGVVMNGVLARRQAVVEEAELTEQQAKVDQPVADGRKPIAAKTDRYGDPLPEGAVRRGWGRCGCRHGALEFTPRKGLDFHGRRQRPIAFLLECCNGSKVAEHQRVVTIGCQHSHFARKFMRADGKFIATPQHTGKIGVWDVNTGSFYANSTRRESSSRALGKQFSRQMPSWLRSAPKVNLKRLEYGIKPMERWCTRFKNRRTMCSRTAFCRTTKRSISRAWLWDACLLGSDGR